MCWAPCVVYSLVIPSRQDLSMLPLLFVLLFASSAVALALPTIAITEYDINEIAPLQDNGGISSYLTSNALDLLDGGDSSVYSLTIREILNDLVNQPNSYAQAVALGQTLALIRVTGHSNSGDACKAAAVINEYATGQSTGAAQAWLRELALGVGDMVQLAVNPLSMRYTTGPRGNCAGGGVTSLFEPAWSGILANCSPASSGLMYEEYCAANRMYQSFSVRNNNIAAAVTASAVPSVVTAIQSNLDLVVNFFKALLSGNNSSAQAAALQLALAS